MLSVFLSSILPCVYLCMYVFFCLFVCFFVFLYVCLYVYNDYFVFVFFNIVLGYTTSLLSLSVFNYYYYFYYCYFYIIIIITTIKGIAGVKSREDLVMSYAEMIKSASVPANDPFSAAPLGPLSMSLLSIY